MIRILVVDDHPIVRDGFVTVFEDQEDMEVVDTADSVATALIRGKSADVVLLDLELTDGSGLTVLRELEGPKILVLTAFDNDEELMDALRSGAAGYLLKGTRSEDIVSAVRRVAAGETVVDPRLAGRVATRLAQGPPVSPRENEVLKLLGDGLSNREIGERLSVTERTVKFHVSSLLAKLEAENRTHLVKCALDRGLLSRPRS